MLRSRIILAHVLVLGGCSSSHGMGGDDAGIDGGSSISDGGSLDGGGNVIATCDAAGAQPTICGVTCDGPPTWYWNGDECTSIDCGACTGEDCGTAGFSSESACVAAHTGCAASVCRSTGGTWRWWAQECGHHVCGIAPPANCEVGFAVCDCGLFERFDETAGCVPDPDCPIPEPVTREELCTGTGGTWGAFCCDAVCGVPCGDDCVAPACDCGPMRAFDEGRGCYDAARCHERLAGESCDGIARCTEQTICCDSCGGAGCAGDPTCITPVCDDDPGYDQCGNCLLCP